MAPGATATPQTWPQGPGMEPWSCLVSSPLCVPRPCRAASFPALGKPSPRAAIIFQEGILTHFNLPKTLSSMNCMPTANDLSSGWMLLKNKMEQNALWQSLQDGCFPPWHSTSPTHSSLNPASEDPREFPFTSPKLMRVHSLGLNTAHGLFLDENPAWPRRA